MSLRNLLNRKLVSCAPDTTVRRAAKLMEKEDVGAILVLFGGKPIGILTDRDIVVQCVSQGLDCEERPVSDIMSETVNTVNIDSGIYDVIRLMKKNKVRRTPVIDENGKAVGFLSFGDIFQLLSQEIADLSECAVPEDPKIIQRAA